MAEPRRRRRSRWWTATICARRAIVAGAISSPDTRSPPVGNHALLRAARSGKYGGTMLQAEARSQASARWSALPSPAKKAMTATSGPGMSARPRCSAWRASRNCRSWCVECAAREGRRQEFRRKASNRDLFPGGLLGARRRDSPVMAPVQRRKTVPITIEAFNLAEYYQTPVHHPVGPESGAGKETAGHRCELVRISRRQKPTGRN